MRLVLLVVVCAVVAPACFVHTECDADGRRESYIWNDDGLNGSNETLTIVDTNILPPEDLPYVMIVDTDDDVGGEDPLTDALFLGNDEPIDVEMDYRWGTGPVRHAEFTVPDDCPPA